MAVQGLGLTSPWEGWRTFTLGASIAFCVVTFVFINIPLGWAAFGVMVVLAYVCKPIGEPGNNGRHYTPDSKGFKRARFLMAYRARLRDATKPLVVFGFGPSMPDEDHGYQPGWTPFGRLSSIWSYLAAGGLTCLDFWLRNLHFTQLPEWFWIISTPLSFVGWLHLIQSVNYVKLVQADGVGIVGMEPAPATMIRSLKEHYDFAAILRKALFIGLGVSAVPVLLELVFRTSWMIMLVTVLITVAVSMLVAVSKLMKTEYRAKWAHRVERREFWSSTLSFLRDNTPILVVEASLPSLEEWEAAGGGSGDEPYQPSVHLAVFRFAPNATFADYARADIEERVKGALEAAHVTISPVAAQNPDTGEDIPGSIGAKGFRLWWTESHIDINGVLEPSTDNWLREFGAGSSIVSVINQVRGLGYNTLVSCALITRPTSSVQILELTIAPTDPNVNISNFQRALSDIEGNVGVKWVRAYKPQSMIQAGAPTNVAKLLVAKIDPLDHESAGLAEVEAEMKASGVTGGRRPRNRNAITFTMPATRLRKIIQSANWQYYFRSNNVQSTSSMDVPEMLENKAKTAVVNELTFALPDGLEFSRVKGALEGLKQISGNSFMEINQGASSVSSGSTQEERDRIVAQAKSSFTVVASKKDPLARIFNFGDYEDKILTTRSSGNERLIWHPGVLANDELAVDDFNADEPHLLIAGTSGSGKSVILQSMILQMAYNNTPDDMRFWMMEPKIGMQRFRHLDSIEHFVDPWSFDGKRVKDQFFESCAEMLEMAVSEMERRNEVLQRRSMTPGQSVPEKLSQGRTIAKREGPQNNGLPHEMMFPFITLIMEECATIYTGASDKDVANSIAYNSNRIAREGRSAGIFMVNLTQYPTNASIPSTIRQQMRRLGLATSNALASRVIIDQDGLEQLRIKGTGLIRSGYGYRQFRGFYLRDGDTAVGEPNDIIDISNRIPLSAMAQSLGVNTSMDPKEVYRLLIPEPGPTIFDMWKNSQAAQDLMMAVETGRETRNLAAFND